MSTMVPHIYYSLRNSPRHSVIAKVFAEVNIAFAGFAPAEKVQK